MAFRKKRRRIRGFGRHRGGRRLRFGNSVRRRRSKRVRLRLGQRNGLRL